MALLLENDAELEYMMACALLVNGANMGVEMGMGRHLLGIWVLGMGGVGWDGVLDSHRAVYGVLDEACACTVPGWGSEAPPPPAPSHRRGAAPHDIPRGTSHPPLSCTLYHT